MKILWGFLPDGTFTAAPLEDPGRSVDKDRYELINDGATIKIRSQLLDGGSTVEINRSTMTGETAASTVKFTKLQVPSINKYSFDSTEPTFPIQLNYTG